MLAAIQSRTLVLWQGLTLSVIIGMAACYLSLNLGGPVMLYALLFGMAFNHLAADSRYAAGIAFSARHILRVGVVLLGVGITWTQISLLGWASLILIVGGITVTLLLGSLLGRWVSLGRDHAILSAGAVAICGASAALAISAVLPQHPQSERNTLITVVGVTALSTLAMVLYPLVASALSLNEQASGIFIGATIHDVAQVIGAGYMMSDEVGVTATIVKLFRVACLLPVVFLVGLGFRKQHTNHQSSPPVVPVFLLGFLVMLLLNSLGWLPVSLTKLLQELSRWCLITAVAALGAKTSVRELSNVGVKPLLALSLQSLLLAGFILAMLLVLG